MDLDSGPNQGPAEVEIPASGRVSGVYYDDETTNSTYMVVTTKSGGTETRVPKRLANFRAEIREEVEVDDGDEVRTFFRILAHVGKGSRVVEFDVPARDFASLNWVHERLGAAAYIQAGNGNKDHARQAFQQLSGEPGRASVYSHTGWRRIGGRMVYLTAAGAISADGLDPLVRVDLERNLERFRIEEPKSSEADCIEAVFALIEIGPAEITVPVLAAALLAPLVSLFSEDSPDFVVWLWGKSGGFKSELASLAQSLFGDFLRTQLPASFTSTANAHERQWFCLKDALLVVDDYYPTDCKRDADAMRAVAERLLRGVGNRKGRDRMMANSRNRAGLAPRGMVIATGENLLGQQSATARMFAVKVPAGSIDVPRLTEAQRGRRLLSGAMYYYLRWLAANYEAVSCELSDQWVRTRSKLAEQGQHRRQPSQVAFLLVAFCTFIRFACERVQVPLGGCELMKRRAYDALAGVAEEHGQLVESQSPVLRFVEVLRTALATGSAHLTTRSKECPPDPKRWGWRDRERRSLGEPAIIWEPINSQGWVGAIGEDKDGIMVIDLDPDATFRMLQQECMRTGSQFPLTKPVLISLLAESGYLAMTNAKDGGRKLAAVKICGVLGRYLRIPLSKLGPEDTSEESW